MIECAHWSECNVGGGGCCAIGKYGGKPAMDVCLQHCPDYDGPPRGMGDRVAATIKRVTRGKVGSCGGCGKRQMALNRLLPARSS